MGGVVNIEIRADALTHEGRVRTQNEDAYLCDPRLGLFAVADGMGGHKGGEVASRMAIEGIQTALQTLPAPSSGAGDDVAERRAVLQWIRDTFEQIHLNIFMTAQQQKGLRGMGSTLDLALIRGNGIYLGHAGDSRSYLCRHGRLHRLTQDHSMGDMLLAQGSLSKTMVAKHPQRNALLKALGLNSGHLDPDTSYFQLTSADTFLLCSDGLYGSVSEAFLLDTLTHQRAVKAACQTLVHEALNAGGKDNITALVFSVANATGEYDAILGTEKTSAAMRASSLFELFTEAELLSVQRIATPHQFPSGTLLVQAGQVIDAVVLILEGRASVWSEQSQIGQIGAGDPFGDLALVPNPSSVAIRAETPMTVLEFPLAYLRELLDTDPAMAAKLSFAALQRLQSRIDSMAQSLGRYRRIYGPTPTE